MAESNDSEFDVKEFNRHCRVCPGVAENMIYIHLPRGNEQNTPAKLWDRCRQRSAMQTYIQKYILLVLPSYCYEGHSVFRVYSEHLEGVSVDPTH